MIRDWLRFFRQQQPPTAAELQRTLAGLRRQQTETIARRDDMALDAVHSDAAAEQYQQFAGEAGELARQIQMLEAALPHAERQEAEAARQAEADTYAKRMERFRHQTAEAQRWLDAVLARLPTGQELTEARALRDALRDEARELSRWSRDAAVRRPVDPLDALSDAFAMRTARIERARWAKSAPITLLDDTKAAS